jgi:uncharacterized protein (TIGR03118 family)
MVNARGWTRWKQRTAAGGAALALVGGLAAGQAALAGASGASGNGVYRQDNLVSDIDGVARITDTHLVNPWGLAEHKGSPLWVANNNSDTSTLYVGDQEGTPLIPAPPGPTPLVVTFPTGSNPSGQVDGTGTPGQFTVDGSPALFIFSSESGHIFAWGLKSGTTAKTVATSDTAVYKGLARVDDGGQPKLYATNFHDGTVDVYDSNFKLANKPGMFVDPQIPAHYAPFGIQAIGGWLYVTYAQQNDAKHDDVKGDGHGFVDVYKPDGTLVRRLITMGALNSPWGLVKTPEEFGRFSNDLLVGNFGDGKIHAYDLATGALEGTLTNRDGNAIAINGLWGLIFGDKSAGTPNTLFFSAGIADETHGLLGSITPGDD